MPRSSRQIIEHGEALAARFESAEPNPLDDVQQRTMDSIRDAALARGRAESAIVEGVQEARRLGVSWSVIAAVLGVSRQAAQQRYG